METARLAAWLDEHGISAGANLELTPIGDGHSNLTYHLQRGGQSLIVRRPPEGPVAPSAHNVLREAAWMRALRPLGIRVPQVLATCDDDTVMGAPFFVMEKI